MFTHGQVRLRADPLFLNYLILSVDRANLNISRVDRESRFGQGNETGSPDDQPVA